MEPNYYNLICLLPGYNGVFTLGDETDLEDSNASGEDREKQEI